MPFDKARFYATVRDRLGKLSASQVAGFETVLHAIKDSPLAWQAYMLATAWHETGKTMQPIREWGGYDYYLKMYDVMGKRPDMARAHGNVRPGDGARYFGRGFVQLTWFDNYQRAGKAVGVDLIAKPELALDPAIASAIMVRGMTAGWFTGRGLGDYLPREGVATKMQYIAARRIINGIDKADLIEDYAQVFERALRDGGVA